MIYTGSVTSRAYVQSSSNPLEIFHSLCKISSTKSEPHRDNPSLMFKNPLQQETHGLLNPFSEVRRREEEISLKRDRLYKENQSKFLIEYASGWPRDLFERIRQFSSEKLLIFWEDKTFWEMKTPFKFVFPSHLWWPFIKHLIDVTLGNYFLKIPFGNQLQDLCNRLQVLKIWIKTFNKLLVINYRPCVISYTL